MSHTAGLLDAPAAALALFGAHFHRAGAWPLLVACVVLLGLLTWRRLWCVQAVRGWAWTAFVLLQQRMVLGQPWLRLALILGAVAAATAASSFVVRQPALLPSIT